ncbi:MAG: DUF2892 domain-containing protein, partial [Taibaiella sp.]|nr:DUF2892 domain-containing protein [Taibaiella sp.]
VVAAMLIAMLLLNGQMIQVLIVPAIVIAVLFLITGITGYCPLYKLFKINTRNKVKQNKQTL